MKFLTVVTLKKDKLRHRAKFRQNRSNCGRDILIFQCSKMTAATILHFKNFKFLTVGTVKNFELHRYVKFRRNRR